MISTTTISAKYTVTDGVLDYGIPFHIYDSADVSVIWSSDGLTDKSLTLDTDYSVTILSEGGTVTLVAGAVPIGSILVVESAIPATQNADFSSTTTVSTEALETQLDRQVQMIQQLSSGLDRAVKTPATSATTPEDMAEDIFDARDQAEQSATAAAASATAAADSATAAAGSATTASQEATAAADSADLASQKATAATGSAANAATQADNAAGSATAAADSATAAASSATAAKDSEDQAFNYASQSLGSAGQAQNYAAQSLDYAGQSLSSAQAAAGSATTASQEATAAAGSATTAADSADLSRRWASEDVDVPVQSGEYSAKHYAHKAKDAVPDNLVSRVEAVEGKTQSATTSTRGIGRVATAADMVTGATIDNGPAFLSVGSVVTPTPTANAVPQADASGKLDDWITKTDTVAATGTALATQKCAWDTAMQVGTSLLLSTKPSMPGDWQITGVVIGKPLFIVMNRSTPTGVAKLKTISGADGGQGETGTSATSGYVLGYSTDGKYASSNCYIVFPNKETVIIRVIELTAGANIQLKAYQ